LEVNAQEKEKAQGKLPRELNKGRDFERLWLVYFEHCIDGFLCTGIINDLTPQLENRNFGNASRYTRSGQLVVLVYKDVMAVGNIAKQDEFAFDAFHDWRISHGTLLRNPK
jgi:predicted GIY-YIG superfamily endonuclease